ncbi:MAG: diaminopimelate epimerase [Bacteroidales bacterium]|nr:diaminopimelate epimerase [Bacteroidales bacterium]
MLKFYKYSGAGNTFVVIDGRKTDVSRFRRKELVHALCLQNRTDGLMILNDSETADFKMEYFNPDGSGGMMCGNGGRCIVAFADLVGVKAFHSKEYVFEAPDGIHRAEILAHLGEMKTVRLQMKEVEGYEENPDGIFLNTGTRHVVRFVEDAREMDVETEGKAIRHAPAYAPEGTNVNFVSVDENGSLRVRTYEKGVEAETLACGTGITASAVAACVRGVAPASLAEGVYHYDIQARQDRLSVEFRREGESFRDVYLTGPTLNLGDLVE